MNENLSIEERIKLINSNIEDMKKRNIELNDMYKKLKYEASKQKENEEITKMVMRIREQNRKNVEQWMLENGYENTNEVKPGEK